MELLIVGVRDTSDHNQRFLDSANHLLKVYHRVLEEQVYVKVCLGELFRDAFRLYFLKEFELFSPDRFVLFLELAKSSIEIIQIIPDKLVKGLKILHISLLNLVMDQF